MKRILAILAFTVCGHAAAQAIDHAWILERVTGARWSELDAVKAESDRGSPVAMHWWGLFLDNCLFGSCDPEGAKALWRRAAAAGHADSRLLLMQDAQSVKEADALLGPAGPATP